jgi:hypothetical protein
MHLTNIENRLSKMKVFNIVCWLNNIESQPLKKLKKPTPTS